MKHLMKNSNRKNHEINLKKLESKAIELGIEHLTKSSAKTAIERFLAEN